MTLRQPALGHGGNARFDAEVTTMVSKAIASLDVWLARAEALLQEQREQAISPSLVPTWGSDGTEEVLPLAAFERGLESLLGGLCRGPGRWILIAEDNARRAHFWQALAFEDGSLVTEVVSDFYLEGDDRWTPDQEARLAALGWEAPDPPRCTNWIVVEPTTSPPVAQVAARAVATLREVFGLGDNDELFIKLIGSPIRGDTPAGPVYDADDAPVNADADADDPFQGDWCGTRFIEDMLAPRVGLTDEQIEAAAEEVGGRLWDQYLQRAQGTGPAAGYDPDYRVTAADLIDPGGGPPEEPDGDFDPEAAEWADDATEHDHRGDEEGPP